MAKTVSKSNLATVEPQSVEPKAAMSAAEMGARQRDISVSEFFTKNRHLLGFDNPRKALLTCVKEAVDNALDACEEAGILPEVVVKLEVASNGAAAPAPSQANRFRITVIDYGPGIVRQQIPPIFAKLLYGSKFHRLRMSRGQQGIGIFGRRHVCAADDREAGADHLAHEREIARSLFRSPDRYQEK